MIIYPQEVDDKIADKVKASRILAYNTQLKPITPEYKTIAVNHTPEVPELSKASAQDWDLYGFYSVLASVGWNDNDDVFDAGETWLAKSTPEHKRVNYEHEEDDVIGHIVSSIVVDEDGNVIEGDTVPDKYDVITASLLYKTWEDENRQKRMDEIIEGIAKGEWYVSMECLLRNFDYALITPDGEHKIIPRTKATSYLTRHLRVYGGSGEYGGNKVGRLLRNFTFSGKGIVRVPANKRSIIFNSVKPFSETGKASLQKLEKKMSENDIVVSQLTKDLEVAKASNDKLVKQLETLKAEADEQAKKEYEKQVASLNEVVEKLTKDAEEYKQSIAGKETEVSSLKDEIKSLNETVEAAKKEAETLKQEKLIAERVSKLVDVKVELSEAQKIVDKWQSATDEQFDDVVSLHAEKMKNGKEKNEKDNKDKKDSETATAAELDEAEAEVVVTDIPEDVNLQRVATASAWFDSILKKNK